MMYEYLRYYQIPTLVVATKADKISRGKYQSHLKQIKDSLQLEKNVPIIPFSAKSGIGKEEAWEQIKTFIGAENLDE